MNGRRACLILTFTLIVFACSGFALAEADANDCAHRATYSGTERRNIEYRYCDGACHWEEADLFQVKRCLNCGVYLEETYLSRQDCLSVHEYEGNICTVCGYVDECAHGRFIYGVDYDSATYESYDQEYHLVTGYRCEYRNCEFCGRYFEDACDTELSSELERHSFEDGECYRCGCKNTCTHEITSIYFHIQ